MKMENRTWPRVVPRSLIAATLSLGALFALTSGCSADDKVDNAVDCHSICNRYKDCFDSNYNTGNCESDCRDSAGKDRNYQHKVDMCASCIDDRACAETAFPCTDDCIDVVP